MATRSKKNIDPSELPLAVAPNVPTSSYELEQFVLGTILTDNGQLPIVEEWLQPKHFSSTAHSMIYEAILQLDERNTQADVVLTIEHLKVQQLLDRAGGREYIASLIEHTVYPDHLPAYCKQIADKWILRSLLLISDQVKHDSQLPGVEPHELLSDVQEKIFELSRGEYATGFRPIKDFLSSTFEKIEGFRNRSGHLIGVGTGYRKLDEWTGGFQPGELIIVAARPSVGKTSLALNLAITASRHYGKKVGFISLEMSADQIVLRLLAMLAKLSLHYVRTGKLETDEYDRLRDASDILYNCDLYIDDRSDLALNDVRAKVRRMKKERGIDILFVDYLGLMRMPSNSESLQIAIANTTRGLKALSKEMQIPIVVLAQLSRAAVDADKTDKRPKLHHLRDSGAIEQDADVVLMLYREFYDKGKKLEELTEEELAKRNDAEIIIAKQRNGPTGTVELLFMSEYASFEDKELMHTDTPYQPRVAPQSRKKPADDEGRAF